MITCPECNTELDAETLSVGSSVKCPSCGGSIQLDPDSTGLSSIVGSPGDHTMNPRPGSDSSLTGSSYALSGLADSDLSSEVPSTGSPLDATLEASPRDSSLAGDDDLTPPEIDATMVFGGRQDDDDDEPFLIGDGEESEEDDSADFEDLDHIGSESLDATIDIGRLAAKGPQSKIDLDLPGDEATLDQAGAPTPTKPRLDLDVEGPDEADDMTVMLGMGGLAGGTPSQSDGPSRAGDDATLAADSSAADSAEADSSLSDSEFPGGDSAGDMTESPSTHPGDGSSDRDSATLAFDSERRSDRIGTPEPRELTGLESGGTIPRGPLEEGRGSRSLKPGESQVVGSESVRLRAFLLAEPTEDDAMGIDYAIEGEAGKGGMGVVYKARQQSLDRLVAIKQIKSDMGASASDSNKFVSEAVITGQLEHPNVIPVHDLGLAADGMPFYAMKFVEGDEWEKRVKDLSEAENLSILIQVAQAIAFAHSKEVLHRDLKPGNIMLGKFGEVLVMDWGLAARLDDNSEIQPAGTPIYMPPETALEYLDYAKGRVVGGKKSGSSRKRMPAGKYSDIYLLGALLFKIVSRRAPHRGKSTFECLRNAAKNEIVKVRRSSELLDIAYKAMATDPDDRYPTALDFIEALKAYQSHAQSIQIAKTASRELRAAEKLRKEDNADATEIYASFSRAQHGYQNALDLWSENRKAARRRKKSLRLFAEAAYDNGDYDLALSMLDTESEDDAELRATVLKDQKSRNGRLAWFKTLQYATAASLMLALAFIGYSVVMRQDAIAARNDLKQTIVEAEKVTAGAEKRVAAADDEVMNAKELAEETIAEGAKTAQAAIREGDLAAKAEIARANEQAATKVEEATEEADRKIAAADKQVVVLQKKASLESYKADLGQVQATLATYGAYAARTKFVKLRDSINDNPAVKKYSTQDPTWSYLATATNWESEAVELVDGLNAKGPTYLATSAHEGWTASAAHDGGGGMMVSIYRGNVKRPENRFAIGGTIEGMAISADGRYVAIAGNTLRLVDATSEKELVLSNANGQAASATNATCVAFHPTRPELLVGRADTGVERWRLNGGKANRLAQKSQWHQTAVIAVGYSPDGSQRFSADASGRIVLWREMGAGSLDAREVYSHEAVASGSPAITAAKMTDDATGRLAYGCDDGSVYEIAGWWPTHNARGEAISKENRTLRPRAAKRLEDGFIDLRPNRLSSIHPQAVTDIDYADRGTIVLSSGGDTLLVQRSVSSDKTLPEFKRERRYHDTTVLSVATGPDGTAYSSDDKGRVTRWKIDVPPMNFTLDPGKRQGSGVAAVHFLPEQGEQGGLSVADRNGFVHQWNDVSRPKAVESLYAGHADNRGMRAWHVPGDSPRIVTVAADSRACIWREEDGLLERVIDLGARTVVSIDPRRRVLYAASDGRNLGDAPAAVAIPLDGGSPTALWQDASRASVIIPLQNQRPGSPTLAVGQRDGQVYLWGRQTGRVNLTRSSSRPHWRPIRALAHDPETGRLYSGDSDGLLVEWALGESGDPIRRQLEETERGSAPIVRLEVASRGRLLAVQRTPSGLGSATLFEAFQNMSDGITLKRRGLRDATIDPVTDRVVALCRTAGQTEIAVWSKATGWRRTGIESSSDGLVRIGTTTDGWLCWGPGIVQWRKSDDRQRLATQIVSRPTPEALVRSRDDGTLKAVTGRGSIDLWEPNGGAVRQSQLGDGSLVLASCLTDRDREILVAVSNGRRSTRLERWNLSSNQQIDSFAAELPGECRAIDLAAGTIVAAFDDQLVTLASTGGRSKAAPIDLDGSRPTSVSMSREGLQVAITTNAGFAVLGSRDQGGDWSFSRLDYQDVTSAAFTPDGTRLIVGVESGRVVLLELADPGGHVRVSRPLLTFTGHNDRVTLLQVEESGPETRIVSGDASGRVVVRSL